MEVLRVSVKKKEGLIAGGGTTCQCEKKEEGLTAGGGTTCQCEKKRRRPNSRWRNYVSV